MLIKKQMNEYWKAGRNKLTLSMVLKLLQRCRCGTDGKIFSRILLILALLAFLPGAGYSNETPTGIDTLRRIVIQEGGDAAWEYLDILPAQVQQDVALLAVADPDNALNTLGITVLVQSGHLDEAVPALSAKVADGDDLSRFGYSWLHSDEPDLVLRMYLKICRDLLVRLDSFTLSKGYMSNVFSVPADHMIGSLIFHGKRLSNA